MPSWDQSKFSLSGRPGSPHNPTQDSMTILLGIGLHALGGMAFALAIRSIGFSMTYGMAIGISAVFGTAVPQILDGTLIANFQKPGGTVVLLAFILLMVGVVVCGRAGEREASKSSQAPATKSH